MTIQKVPSNDAQNEFQFVMDQVCSGLGPVLITGMRGNAVLVCEEEWQQLHEKLRALQLDAASENALDQLEKIVESHVGGRRPRLTATHPILDPPALPHRESEISGVGWVEIPNS